MIKYLHHICIQTEKYEESLDFYTRLLGFELIKETPDFHGRSYNTWLRLGTTMIELQTAKKGEALEKCTEAGEGLVHVCFLVDSVLEEYQRLKAMCLLCEGRTTIG
jgi:glyoxylase I family protein